MFDHLFELLNSFWTDIKLFEIIEPYESGVHIRRGKYKRTLGPGLWWKLPVIDGFMSTNTAVTTMNLHTQTVGNLIVGAIVRYEISDVKAYLLSVWDAHEVISDTTMGAIREVVEQNNDPVAAEKQVLKKVRPSLKKFGVKVHAVTFTDFGKVRSIRLIQE